MARFLRSYLELLTVNYKSHSSSKLVHFFINKRTETSAKLGEQAIIRNLDATAVLLKCIINHDE